MLFRSLRGPCRFTTTVALRHKNFVLIADPANVACVLPAAAPVQGVLFD